MCSPTVCISMVMNLFSVKTLEGVRFPWILHRSQKRIMCEEIQVHVVLCVNMCCVQRCMRN